MRISLSFSRSLSPVLSFVLYIDLHALRHTGYAMHGKIYIVAAWQTSQCFLALQPLPLEIGAENGVQLRTVQIDAYV